MKSIKTIIVAGLLFSGFNLIAKPFFVEDFEDEEPDEMPSMAYELQVNAKLSRGDGSVKVIKSKDLSGKKSQVLQIKDPDQFSLARYTIDLQEFYIADDDRFMTISWKVMFSGEVNNLHFSLHNGKPQVQQGLLDLGLFNTKFYEIFPELDQAYQVDMVVNLTEVSKRYKNRELNSNSFDLYVDGELILENNNKNYEDSIGVATTIDFFSIQSFPGSTSELLIDDIEFRHGAHVSK